VAAEENEDVGEPETAGKKCPFAGRQTILPGSCIVAQYETVADEMPLYGGRRADDPGSSGGRKPTSGMASRLASRCLEP
jgi:hypothetical protein